KHRSPPASAADIEARRATDNEFVIKVAKNNRGITYPVNAPYTRVAWIVVNPAIAKLYATKIGTKKHDTELTKRLPVFGMATENNCFLVTALPFSCLAKRLRIEIDFFLLKTINKYINEAISPMNTPIMAPAAANSIP